MMVKLSSAEADGIGLWRSLVAHLTGGQGVAGSNPVSPTKKVPETQGFPGLLRLNELIHSPKTHHFHPSSNPDTLQCDTGLLLPVACATTAASNSAVRDPSANRTISDSFSMTSACSSVWDRPKSGATREGSGQAPIRSQQSVGLRQRGSRGEFCLNHSQSQATGVPTCAKDAIEPGTPSRGSASRGQLPSICSDLSWRLETPIATSL